MDFWKKHRSWLTDLRDRLSQLPDQLFHNVRTSKSVYRQILRSLETSIGTLLSSVRVGRYCSFRIRDTVRPTSPPTFTILKPQDQEICEFYVVHKRLPTDFKAPKLWKGSQFCIFKIRRTTFQNDVPKIRRSADFEALKLGKGMSGVKILYRKDAQFS